MRHAHRDLRQVPKAGDAPRPERTRGLQLRISSLATTTSCRDACSGASFRAQLFEFADWIFDARAIFPVGGADEDGSRTCSSSGGSRRLSTSNVQPQFTYAELPPSRDPSPQSSPTEQLASPTRRTRHATQTTDTHHQSKTQRKQN